jgi:hypothetical protein
MLLPTKQTELFDGLLDDKVTIFADRTHWQKRCIEVIPECVKRAHEAFGMNLPHASFYFFSSHADFTSYYQELFGSKPRYAWQSGTGSYIREQGIVLISDKGKKSREETELGLVMHEYSHVLCRSRYANQQSWIPTWLEEGCADYLAMPWYQELFKSTSSVIRGEANARRVATYQSFGRSVYTNARAGYAIARLMVDELMRDQQLDTLAYIFDEAKRRNGAFADVIKEICGLTPKQLYEKVLADCEVDQASLARSRKSSQQRQSYWIPWASRKEMPSTFHECLFDLHFWKLEHYGRNYREHELNSYKYPNWREFAVAYLHFLSKTNCARMKKNERDELRAMHRLDRCARLLTYVSPEEIVPVLWQPLPLETTEHLSKCIDNLNDLVVRKNLRKEMSRYLQRFPPTVDATPTEAFTNEFETFTSYRFHVLGGDEDAAGYDRWPQLATALVRLLKDRPASRWSKNLQQYMQSLTLHDEHQYIPGYISDADRKSLLECDLPESLRQYLGGQKCLMN